MKRQIIGSLTVGLILTAASFGARKGVQQGQSASEGQITIRVHDYAQANLLVRQHAEQVASEILRKAGVATRWSDCPIDSPGSGACSSPMSTLDFFVNLLPHSMSDGLHRPGGVLGAAFEGNGNNFGFIASIFYDVTGEVAAASGMDFGELLGDVIAHELGHLLLGTNSHSGFELMSAFWRGNQFRLIAQRGLAFSDVEAKRIHAAITARMQAAAASHVAAESSRVAPSEQAVAAGFQQVTGGTQ